MSLHQAGLGAMRPGESIESFGDRASRSLEGVDSRIQRLVALDGAGTALTMRLARDLAWMDAKDPAVLGYPTFQVYFKNRVHVMDLPWARQLMRLERADLPLVKHAVLAHGLPLSIATRAPCRVQSGQEHSWLFDALNGRGEFRGVDAPSRSRGPSSGPTVFLRGQERKDVESARSSVRRLLGQPISEPKADRFLVNLWKKGRTGRDILREARKKPPAPDHAEPVPADPQRDPTTPLLGPWSEPRSVAECAERVDRLQGLIQDRTLLMGRLYGQIVDEKLYRVLGFSSAKELVERLLRCSVRSLRRYRRQARALDADPAVVRARNRGLTLDRIVRLKGAVDRERWYDWLEVAPRIVGFELDQVLPELHDPRAERRWLRAYQRLAARAPERTDRISLRCTFNRPVPTRTRRVHPDLVLAARWFLREATPPPQKGFGRVKERDRFTCRNPECRTTTIRAHAHHHVPRSQGGTNDYENGLCHCPGCHLRGIHSGRIQCEIQGDLEIWTYPGRRVVVG